MDENKELIYSLLYLRSVQLKRKKVIFSRGSYCDHRGVTVIKNSLVPILFLCPCNERETRGLRPEVIDS